MIIILATLLMSYKLRLIFSVELRNSARHEILTNSLDCRREELLLSAYILDEGRRVASQS
ncbi:unnamed protein product [Amoebophrya sp. A25]|nr:unnamed protein product [Amoebophrya sp. A25]|eukprot:GSA25T00011468001.1